MITGKDLDRKLEIEQYIEDYITLHFGRIDRSNYIFLDEIYSNIHEKINRIKRIGSVRYKPIDEYDFVDEVIFQEFIDDYRNLSEINYKMIPELFSGLQRISDNISSISEDLNKLSYESSVNMKAMEEDIKGKLLMQSIKEESIIYDPLGPGSNITNEKTRGNLTINEQARSITLPVGNSTEIPFSISIECNKDKGSQLVSAFGEKTFDCIENGYFHSRMFSTNPRFEVEELDTDISNLEDGDPETGIMFEYNSLSGNDTFTVTAQIQFEESKVDEIRMIFEPLGTDSTIGVNNIYPKLTRLHIENNEAEPPISEDIHSRVLDNTLSINGRNIGEYDTGVNYSGVDIFPTANYIINTNPVTNIMLEYTVTSPQEIYYLEKAVYDYRNIETFRFNYFETLVLNNYITPEARRAQPGDTTPSDPYSFYDSEELAEMNDILNASYMTKDQKIRLYRYMVGFKDIKLFRTSYIPTGSTVTGNLIPENTTAASVELFVNEITDDDTSIKYYISNNQSSWTEIIPTNRTTSSTYGKRVVFSGFESRTDDAIIEGKGTSLYLKIEMKGTESRTPVLNAYSLKVKYL